jgi:hypothetical protein
VQIAGLNQAYEVELSRVVLNEDVTGLDEIAAEFTLSDRSNNHRVIRRSNVVQRNFG